MLIVCMGELASLEGECTHRPILGYATAYVDKRKSAVLEICQSISCRKYMHWTKKTELRRERMREVDESFG